MLELAYILLSLLILFLLLVGLKRGLKEDESYSIKRMALISLGLVLWFVYLLVVSKSGILEDLSLPPKFPLLIFLPITAFFILFFVKNKNSKWVQSIPLTWTAYFQSFRILVELLLYYTLLKGIIPIEATFEGYNFDIIFGVSALFVGYFLVKNPRINHGLLMFWNVLGILMVLFVGFIIATSTYRPELWGYQEPAVSLRFLRYPYLLIPGFLAPVAIFIHIVSFIQLRKM